MTSRMIAVMPISRPAWRCEICQQFKPCCLQTAIVGLAPTHKDPTTVATPLQLMIPATDVAPKAKRAIPADCSDSELLASMIRLCLSAKTSKSASLLLWRRSSQITFRGSREPSAWASG